MIIVLAIAIVILACSSIAFCVAFSKLWDKYTEMKNDYKFFGNLMQINNKSIDALRELVEKQTEVYNMTMRINKIQSEQYELIRERVETMTNLCSILSDRYKNIVEGLHDFYVQQSSLDEKYDHIYDMFDHCSNSLKELEEKYDYICTMSLIRGGDQIEAPETQVSEMAGVEETKYDEPNNESSDSPPSGAQRMV